MCILNKQAKKIEFVFLSFPCLLPFLHRSLSFTLNWGYEGDKEGPTRMAVATLHRPPSYSRQ